MRILDATSPDHATTLLVAAALASISRTVTATAMMRLVEQGRLDFEGVGYAA